MLKNADAPSPRAPPVRLQTAPKLFFKGDVMGVVECRMNQRYTSGRKDSGHDGNC